MIVDLPHTTSAQVNQTLVELRGSGGAVALGRVLTLLIIVDHAADTEAAITAANAASKEHPCRIIVVVHGSPDADAVMDGQLRIGGDAGASEVVILQLSGPLTAVPDSAVMGLLLPDAPIVAWWPGGGPTDPAGDPLGVIAQRRITDAAADEDPIAALQARAAHYRPGDTDLAWARLTRWRATLVAALDRPPHERVVRAEVAAQAGSASGALLAGWLAEVLDVEVRRSAAGEAGIHDVTLQRASGPVRLHRPSGDVATLSQPGEPERTVELRRRPLDDTLVEELRRLDPDEVYERALRGLSRVAN